MKANVWEWSELDVAAQMDRAYKGDVEAELTEKLKDFGFNKDMAEQTSLERLLRRQGTRVQGVPLATVRDGSLTDEERAYDRGLDVPSDRA
jgi:hypothetical protein